MNKSTKTLLSFGSIAAVATPVALVVSCGSEDVKATSNAAAIKGDAKFDSLKTTYTGFSKDTIKIIGHKQEVQKQSAAAISAFNQAFGTKLQIEQIGGTTNYAQYLSQKFTSGSSDVGLVGLELESEINAIGSHAVDFPNTGFYQSKIKDLGSKKVLPAASESLGVVYNKDVFQKNGITVHEGEDDGTGATDGITTDSSSHKITDVYTNDLTLDSYKALATQLNAVSGVDGFYSTTKTDAGNIWPYTNHLLSAAAKVNGITDFTTGAKVFGSDATAGVPKSISDAIDVYSIGSNIDTNSVDSAMGKLAAGKVAMSQNGTWATTQIFKTNPGAKIGFLPMPVFGKSAHAHAQFMKGETQKWTLTTSDDAKQKTIEMFLDWLYDSQSGINALYNDFSSESPFAMASGVTPEVKNPLFASAANYSNNAVTEGELALSAFPSGFNNDSQPLRTAMHNGFKSPTDVTNAIAEYDKLYKA